MICPKCKTELPEAAVCCWACGKKLTTERKHRKRSNGTGSISKLAGNRARPWLARRNGISIGTFATRAEAQKALERLTDATVTEKFNMTFKQIYDAWLPEHERTISQSAKGTYVAAMKHCEQLHGKRFRSLRKSDFQKVIIEMEKKGLSKSSCEKVMQLFGQLSAWAIQEEIIQTNYSQFCTITAEQKSEGKVFSTEAIKAIQQSQNPAADIVLIMIATGCRGNELFSAPIANCMDRYFVGGSKTDAGKNRIIAVAPVGLDAYRKIRANAQGKEKLIDGYEGNKTYTNFAKREFKELMKEIGCQDYTPYDCRHTFTTQAVRAGIDPQTLKRMLGHADLSTTDKYYTHLGLNDILSAVGNLDLTSAVCSKCVTGQKPGQKAIQKSSQNAEKHPGIA